MREVADSICSELCALMTNNLLREWHLRIKFGDDTTALEILPRNGISLLNVAVSDIHKFSIEHNMKAQRNVN